MKMKKEHSATQSSQSPTGLVLEGGGLRAMFTGGVLDVFMQNNIRFDATVGVSAGVLFGCNYKSNQPGRALRYNIRFKDNPEYMSWKSLFRTGNYVNERFSYHLLPHVNDPMDFEAYRENPMKFYAVCTDIEEGCPVYHEIDDADGNGLRWMQASASMPVFAKPVEIDGRHYLDGGITDKRIQKECRHSDPAVRLQEEKGACRTCHEDVSETISQGGAADGKATYYV